MELPTQKQKPLTENPKFTILFGKPKSGKTTIVAALENALIIDTEGGSNYVECMSVQVRNMDDLKQLKTALIEANEKKGGCVYKYGVIDTATMLEDISLELALTLYKATPMGKGFKETDVRTLANGAGWLYVRDAFQMIIEGLKPLFDHIILVGHTKDKIINKQGKELSENSLDLTGKLERIMAGKADALGYVYRNKNQTIINFNGGGDFIVEARPAHLRGKEIVIAESDAEGNMTFHWDKIFIE